MTNCVCGCSSRLTALLFGLVGQHPRQSLQEGGPAGVVDDMDAQSLTLGPHLEREVRSARLDADLTAGDRVLGGNDPLVGRDGERVGQPAVIIQPGRAGPTCGRARTAR
jgi:hypothetical protein